MFQNTTKNTFIPSKFDQFNYIILESFYSTLSFSQISKQLQYKHFFSFFTSTLSQHSHTSPHRPQNKPSPNHTSHANHTIPRLYKLIYYFLSVLIAHLVGSILTILITLDCKQKKTIFKLSSPSLKFDFSLHHTRLFL